ncbi:MAG: hypothetical protein NTX25_11170, partial [Proteobacteria bacterium]|nr:hypothetical protein [Pseudomonadota bacterium]
MERNLKATILWAFLAIPMHDAGRWEVEKYSKIPAHTLDFSSAGLKIQIDKSASPLFYALPSVQRVYGFKVQGEFQGLPRFLNTPKQGDKGADDYALRIGFIVPGEKKLTGLRRVLAPDWVKNLYDKIPKGLGLDRVQFFNITQNPAQLNLTRVHPLSELIQE